MTATELSTAREEALDSAQGWLIVGLGICILTTIWGAVFTFTVYADRLAATFGLSALQASSIFSITTAFFLMVGGLFGVFAARFPLRPVLATAGVGLAVATALLQIVNSYVGVIVAFALLGTAGGTAFTIVISLVPQWFDAYQGLATSLTMTGIGFGPLVLPFAWLWLLDRTGLRTAFAVVIGVAAVLVFVSSIVYHRPSGGSQNATTVDTAWLHARIGDARFLCTAIGFALAFGWYYVLSSHLTGILTANGIDVEIAAAGLSIIGGISVFTRVGGGVIGDRVGQRKTFVASGVLASVCAFVFPFAHSNLFIYIVLFGFGIALGPLASLWSPIVLTRFGSENATATVGLINIATAGSAFLVPLTASALHRVVGGSVFPFITLGVLTVLGAALFRWGTAPQSGDSEQTLGSLTSGTAK
ncbi:MFS transporter [Halocatena pleomorpha]|uniref:MFS transporter n=1 Tax=Halocatena pleomorpha TaxID=1785090 RepID=A0A3P3R882_9EURY|nr:MFS transporter [Halocatena pleomorpha]RRJ29574.1 MFS transporter [Halocatena pleomorpha]